MRVRSSFLLPLSLLLSLVIIGGAVPASAHPELPSRDLVAAPLVERGSPDLDRKPAGRATIKVRFRGARGVPSGVRLVGPTKTSVVRSNKKSVVTAKVRPGRYRIISDPSTYRGQIFESRLSKHTLRAVKGKSIRITVTITRVSSAFDLAAVAVSGSGAQLVIKRPSKSTIDLRRASGDVPLQRRSGGTRVAISGTKATDKKLRPGATYTYVLFAKKGRRWLPAQRLVVSTTSKQGVSYVARPGSFIVEPNDRDRVVVTEQGVVLQPANDRPAPIIGAGVILPPSPTLPTGMLARIDAILPDGSLRLVPGDIPTMFDDFHADVDLDTLPAVPARVVARSDAMSPRRTSGFGASCGPTTGTEFDVSMKPGGDFDYDVDHRWHIPVGAWMRAEVSPTLSVTLTSSIGVGCDAGFTAVASFPIGPVPFVLATDLSGGFKTTVGIADTGRVKVGVRGTVGFGTMARLGLSPVVEVLDDLDGLGTSQSTVEAYLGGGVTFGPGVGSNAAGVVVGIRAFLDVLDASLTQSGTCTTTSLKSSVGASLQAQVWLGPFAAQAEHKLAAIDLPWPNSPSTTCRDDDPASSPVIATTTLPDATIGESYDERLHLIDDRDGTWTIESGDLPAGLLWDDGRIHGTPTTEGPASFTVAFRDSRNRVARRELEIQVLAPEEFVLPWAYQAIPYDATLHSDSATPGTWQVTGLPTGLTLEPRSGRVTGRVGYGTPSRTWLTARFVPDIGIAEPARPVELRFARDPIGINSLCGVESEASGRFVFLFGTDDPEAPTVPGKFVVNGVESTWGTKPGTTSPGWVRKKVVIMRPGQSYSAQMWAGGHKIAEFTTMSTTMPAPSCGVGPSDILASTFPRDEEILGD